MLVARFSDNIEMDIKRGFSCWMHPGLGGSIKECERDAEELGLNCDVRELPEGGYGLVHHEGLSCYALDAETVEAAIEEVKNNNRYDGSGFGHTTVGEIKLLASVNIGKQRMLHILEVEGVECES